MAGMPQQDGGNMITGINVTPLVDITLVLLIVFMVTATYIVKASIDVELPKAAQGGETVGDLLTVVVKQAHDGASKRQEACDVWAVDGTVVDEATLLQRLAAAVGKNKDARVLISADADCRHGEFVHVVDLVKGQGISKFSINIEKTVPAAAAP